jgi:hypothetical protein
VPALGPEIDHVVRRLDDVEMVLDHDHRVTRVHQLIERSQQPLDVARCSPVVGSSRM